VVNPGVEVGITAMVDEFGATAAHGAVQAPITVEGEQVDILTLAAPLCLPATNAFSGVLDHLAARRDVLGCIHSPAVNLGSAYSQPETAVLYVQFRFSDRFVSHARRR
jgi:hypothetical protein